MHYSAVYYGNSIKKRIKKINVYMYLCEPHFPINKLGFSGEPIARIVKSGDLPTY